MNATAFAMPVAARTNASPAGIPGLPDYSTAGTIDVNEIRKYVPVLQHRLHAGEHLYRAGQPFRAIYLVHAGFLKNGLVSDDGRERVTAFRMRGDLMGVESIGAATHVCDAQALDNCCVWELPYPAMLKACQRVPELQMQLTATLVAEIRSDRSWMLAHSTLGAEQRVAAFLLHVASRHEALGYSDRHFVLRMSRADIASFLALKHETVTRALTHLSSLGLIAVQLREVHILDREALCRVANIANTKLH
jgi:CRP/FNR family transcriptional regulator